MNPAEMAVEGRRLTQLLDDALAYLKRQVQQAAETERVYRHAKAEAWVKVKIEVPSGTVAEREAWVNGVTADLRHDRDLADGMRRAAIEAIRSRQQQISLLQSVANAYRAEAEFVRTGS